MLRRTLALMAVAAGIALAISGPAHAGKPCKLPKNVSVLVATPVSYSQMYLTWVDNARDEDGFYVMRRVGQVGEFVEIDDIGPNSQSYMDMTVEPSTEYCYQVQAYNICGAAWSPTACATTPSDQVPPEDPTNLIATTISPTRIDLAWSDNSANEDGFKIEVDEGDTGTFVYLDTVGANVESYPATGLSVGVEYCFRVYAYNVYGNSGYSNEDCALATGQPPAAPTDLDAAYVSATQIDLTWVDNSPTEDGFVIEVDEGMTGTFVYLDTVGANVEYYPDIGLTEGNVYCYRVYATNAYGDSAYSNADCETAGGGPLVVVSTVAEFRAAVEAAVPGTVIELTDGTYYWNDNTTLQRFTDKNNITVRSQSGNRDAVVLQGDGINSGTEFVFKLTRADYITIENLTMRDVYWHCVQVNEGSDHFTVRNCVMWDAGEGPIKSTVISGLNGPFSDYGLVEDCKIGFTTTGQRSVVEGIDLIAGLGWVVRNTEFYNVIKVPAPAYGCFAKAACIDTVIENCYAQNCDVSYSWGGGGSPVSLHRLELPAEHYGGIMRNNIVHTTTGDVGMYINSAVDFKIYNNTLWTANGFSSIDIRFALSTGDIVNNLCTDGYRLRDGALATVATNIWNADTSYFVNQPAADYHLVSTATNAIDKGTNVSADVPIDMDGEARPKGSALDIGADEY